MRRMSHPITHRPTIRAHWCKTPESIQKLTTPHNAAFISHNRQSMMENCLMSGRPESTAASAECLADMLALLKVSQAVIPAHSNPETPRCSPKG
eukprot:763989-Amphidinium_carterae.1